MMKTKSYFRSMIFVLIFVTLFASCTLPANPPEEPLQPDATETLPSEESTEVPTTQLKATATKSEQATLEQATESPVIPATGPSCTVLQDLNVRSGPGTAYDPPIGAFLANTEVIPIAYNPVGYPGGAWVQVQGSAGQTKGWVSAGSAYVSCNIDLTTLASVSVAPPPSATPPPSAIPPQPRRPSAQTSSPSGTCGSGETIDCAVVLSEGLPIQFIVLRDGQAIGSAEGVLNVTFRVDQNGNTVYSNTEGTAAYCLFGGDGPCNSWVLEDNVYKWESGGAIIEAGEYKVNIDGTMDVDANLHWDGIVTISLQ